MYKMLIRSRKAPFIFNLHSVAYKNLCSVDSLLRPRSIILNSQTKCFFNVHCFWMLVFLSFVYVFICMHACLCRLQLKTEKLSGFPGVATGGCELPSLHELRSMNSACIQLRFFGRAAVTLNYCWAIFPDPDGAFLKRAGKQGIKYKRWKEIMWLNINSVNESEMFYSKLR